MYKAISYQKKFGKKLRATILDGYSWEEFDKLINFLLNNYKVKLIKKTDGPDASLCLFECNGKNFELIFDDFYGIYFEPVTEEDEDTVLEVCKSLVNIELDNTTK